MCSRAAILLAIAAVVTAQPTDCDSSGCDSSAMFQVDQVVRMLHKRAPTDADAHQDSEPEGAEGDDHAIMLQSILKPEIETTREVGATEGDSSACDSSAMFQVDQVVRMLHKRAPTDADAPQDSEPEGAEGDDHAIMLQSILQPETETIREVGAPGCEGSTCDSAAMFQVASSVRKAHQQAPMDDNGNQHSLSQPEGAIGDDHAVMLQSILQPESDTIRAVGGEDCDDSTCDLASMIQAKLRPETDWPKLGATDSE